MEKGCCDVKLTILKKLSVEDIHSEYAKKNAPLVCMKGEEGQEFISKNCEIPKQFCTVAWIGLQAKVEALANGTNSPYTKDENIAIHSCNDGLHPVIYKLERI